MSSSSSGDFPWVEEIMLWTPSCSHYVKGQSKGKEKYHNLENGVCWEWEEVLSTSVNHVNGAASVRYVRQVRAGTCSHIALLLLPLCNSTLFQHHNTFAAILTIGLCVGLILSYLPQVRPSHHVSSTYMWCRSIYHYHIISKNSSEGFSPWYLLLGSTSSASGMLNVYMLDADIIYQNCTMIYLSTSGSCCSGIR